MKRYFAVVPRKGGSQKKAKVCSKVPCTRKDPLSFVSWNVNGLSPRARSSEWAKFVGFVKELDVDVVSIQEVRLPAKGEGMRHKMSLGRNKKEVEEFRIVKERLSSLGEYHIYLSLASKKYAGVALLVHKRVQEPEVGYSFECDGDPSKHHPEGRIIFAKFHTFDLLTTYTPNHGSQIEAFHRREKWDAEALDFIKSRKKPIVWIGDLNVAHEACDVTQPAEWWEKQTYQGPLVDCRGQPGFTKAERKRFSQLLQEGGLVDTFRDQNPQPDITDSAGAHWTWRGTPGVQSPEAGRYYKKGMRIDYNLVSSDLLPRVISSTIVGKNFHRSGFYGSDHSPIVLTLKAVEEKERKVALQRCEQGSAK